MSKLEIATSETRARPHFASHTQSSLMKRRTPMKFKKKSSSIRDMNRKPQENVILRLSGIHKRRSNIVKQSRSMQMMIMIFKQQQDRRATVFLPGSELTETSFRLEKSFVSLRSDLIKDISHDLKRCASPAKLATLHDDPTKVVDEFEKLMENSHSQDRTNRTEGDDSENICVSSEDCAIDALSKLQSRSSEEEPVDSHRVVEVLHEIESKKKSNDFPNKHCSEIEMQVHQSVNNATNRRRPRKFWINRKAGAWNERFDVDRACRTDLQNSKSTKHIDNPQDNWSTNDKVVNDNVITWKRSAFQKNSNQRAWRPAGVSRTWTTESTTSLQPMSQKSFQLAEKSTVSSKNKHSSTEHVEAFNYESTSTSISANQSKMLMKENKDPRANRMTKIYEHLAETKQRQRLQTGGTIPKRKQSRTKMDTKVLDKRDNANPIVPKSKSRHCQTRPIMPRESSNNLNVEQHCTKSTLSNSKKSRTLEVMHTLRKIIDSVGEDEDGTKENTMNDDFDHKKDHSKNQTSPNRDTSSENNELNIFTKDVKILLDESRKSINTQTNLDLSSYKKIDAEKDQNLKEILKLTRIVATQTSPSCNKNLVEIGCNTELDLSSYQKFDVEKDQDLREILKLTQTVATQTSPSCNKNLVEIGCNTELDLSSYQKLDVEKDQDLREILKLTQTVATQTSPSCNKNLVEIGCNTELDLSYQKIDAGKNQDLKEILKHTRIVAMQTSPSCNRNVTEIGCNNSNVAYNDVEDSYDLIAFSDFKTEVDPARVEDQSMLDGAIHIKSLSVKHNKINIEGEDTNKNKKLSLNACKDTLNTETSIKLDNYDSEEIPAKTTNNATTETEMIMHERACQSSLRPSKHSDDKINTNIDKHPESTNCANNHNAKTISLNNPFSARSQSSNYDYDTSSEEVMEYLENDVQYEDMVTSELKVEDIPNDVIAAFELAAERARNLHEAVIIHHENLRLKKSENQNEKTVEDYETSEFCDDRYSFGTYNSFISRENEDQIRSEYEAICHFANSGENFDGFSTCSSRGSSSDRICELEGFPRSLKDDYFGTDREKENIFPENEQAIARSILNERSDLDVRSLMQLLMHRTQEEYALELLQLERNGSFETDEATDKTLVLPAIKKPCLISRENLSPLIYCIVCTVVFWFLQFSFRCDSK